VKDWQNELQYRNHKVPPHRKDCRKGGTSTGYRDHKGDREDADTNKIRLILRTRRNFLQQHMYSVKHISLLYIYIYIYIYIYMYVCMYVYINPYFSHIIVLVLHIIFDILKKSSIIQQVVKQSIIF